MERQIFKLQWYPQRFNLFSNKPTVALQRDDGGPQTHEVIIKSNSTDCNRWSYKVRAMKSCRVLTHSTRHIWKMPIMTEQYLWQQIVKGTGHLKGIFTNTDPISQDRIFNPYVICLQMYTNQSVIQEERVLGQLNMGKCGNMNMTDVGQGNDSGDEATKNKFTQNSRRGEIKMGSRCISHKPERLGIEL